MLVLAKFSLIITVLINSTFASFYSFDSDVSEFDRKYCEDFGDWYLVEFENVGVTEPNGGVRGIVASTDSCITSPAVTVDVGGALEVYVYEKVASIHSYSGITVKFIDELSDAVLASYVYDGDLEFDSGWGIIYIPITIRGNVYISILGYSSDEDTIIVEHLNYIQPSEVNNGSTNGVKGPLSSNGESVVIYDDGLSTPDPSSTLDPLSTEDPASTTDPNSTLGPGTTEDPVSITDPNSTLDPGPTEAPVSTPDPISTEDPDFTEEPVIDDDEEEDDSSIWDWLIIVLIVVGCLLAITIVAVSFYYIGKGRSEPIIMETADAELPRTVIIPRVKEVSKSSLYGYD